MQSFVYAVVMFCDGVSTLLYLLLTATSLFWLIIYKVCAWLSCSGRHYCTVCKVKDCISTLFGASPADPTTFTANVFPDYI